MNSFESSPFEEIIVTLYEGSYEFGVGALINSLTESRYEGLVCVGYRQRLPKWINSLVHIKENLYSVNDSIFISFILVSVDMHFGYFKPYFLKQVLLDYQLAERIYYFDPDIVVNVPWNFMTSWTNTGICLCLDSCFPFVHENHPWRKEWMSFANKVDCAQNKVSFYVNSGFIGLKRSNFILLDVWIDMTEKYRVAGGNLLIFEKNGYRSFKGDQDLLNAAITVSKGLEYSIIGTEGMGFTQPAYLMLHAIENIKPWNNNFLISALNGVAPTLAAKGFWKFTEKPIKLYSNSYRYVKLLSLNLSSFISRFYQRN